jgi:hypothetical protein
VFEEFRERRRRKKRNLKGREKIRKRSSERGR